MPITLAPNKLFAKKEDGSGYLPANVVTGQTTEEQCALIEAKGAQTRASIPSDYTALSDSVDDLKSAIDENIFSLADIKPYSNIAGETVVYDYTKMYFLDGAVKATDLSIMTNSAWKHLKLKSKGLKTISISQSGLMTLSGAYAYVIVAKGSTIEKTLVSNNTSVSFGESDEYDVYINYFTDNANYLKSITIQYYPDSAKKDEIQNEEINNVEKTILNYADITAYNITSVTGYSANDRYAILYLENPTFVKNITVKTSGAFEYAIVELENEISDFTVLPSIPTWTERSQNAPIAIESVLNKKRIVVMRYGIGYNESKATSAFKSVGLALYNPSTSKTLFSIFETANQISCTISVYEFGENKIPVINPNIENAVINYAEKKTYTNTGTQVGLTPTIYGVLYFDEPTFVFSFKPNANTGTFRWCFATCGEDIDNGVVLTPGEWKEQTAGSTIIVNGYLSNRRVILLDSPNSNVYYAETRNVDYTGQKLGICNKTTLKATTAAFSGNSWLGEFVVSDLENFTPIPFIADDTDSPCDFSLFYNFGVIGDSYASGTYYPGGTGKSPRILSWPQILGRSSGAEAHNFTIPGCTTKSWYDDTGEYGRQAMLAADPLELYIISLCINDANTGMTVGSLSQIEGVENPETLTGNTFYINYAKIIHAIKVKSTKAKIICLTSDGYLYNQIDKSAYDAAIIDIANYYQIPYCNQHDSPYYKLDVYKNLVNGHPTPPGYACMAKAIRTLIENVMADPSYANYFYTEYLVP